GEPAAIVSEAEKTVVLSCQREGLAHGIDGGGHAYSHGASPAWERRCERKVPCLPYETSAVWVRYPGAYVSTIENDDVLPILPPKPLAFGQESVELAGGSSAGSDPSTSWRAAG